MAKWYLSITELALSPFGSSYCSFVRFLRLYANLSKMLWEGMPKVTVLCKCQLILFCFPVKLSLAKILSRKSSFNGAWKLTLTTPNRVLHFQKRIHILSISQTVAVHPTFQVTSKVCFGALYDQQDIFDKESHWISIKPFLSFLYTLTHWD